MTTVRAITNHIRSRGRDWRVLLRHHPKASLTGFVLGTGAFLALGIFWPKQYSGTALLAVKPSADTSGRAVRASLDQLAAGQDWAALITRYHLYPDVVADSGLAHAAAYLASQVAIGQARPGDGDILIAYAGGDHDTVLGVTAAVANGFTASAAPAAAPAPAGEAETLYATVVLPTLSTARATLGNPGRHSKDGTRPAPALAALTGKLDASLTQGLKLQEALTQNSLNLGELKKQREKAAAAQQTVPTPKPAAATPDSQAERLRLELTRAERTLAELRERYTEEYPDVVTARQRVQDLQLDASRIAAATPRPAKPEPELRRVAPSADPAAIAAQIAQAEAAEARLREAIEQNRTETLWLKDQRDRLIAAGQANRLPAADKSAGDAPQPFPMPLKPAATPSALPATATGPPFFLLRAAAVTTAPVVFSWQFLSPLSLVSGLLAALLAAWLSERRDPSIRNEDMLRRELPPSAAYLGGIPRIRHEIIAD